MLFHEIYGNYYNAVAAILREAVVGPVTPERMGSIVREKAFGESGLTIPAALQGGDWPLLTTEGSTPLRCDPSMPLTTLQKRWLRTLLDDRRIRLFAPPVDGLEDVEPLCPADTFVYFDRYDDGDDYNDPDYIEHFRRILQALREKRKIRIRFKSHQGDRYSWICIPIRLEYSAKDDKFRLRTLYHGNHLTVNLGRVRSCVLLDSIPPVEYPAAAMRKETLVLQLKDERNALERVMLHFSHLEKETERLDDDTYRLTLRYEKDDESEMLIRVLSFGPVLKVVSPDKFIDQMRKRLEKQEKLRLLK